MNIKKQTISRLSFITALIILYIILSLTDAACAFKYFTGISCPLCGMTRAIDSALSLNFKEAFMYHPLWWCIPLICTAVLLWERIPFSVRRGIIFISVILFMSVYIFRLFSGFDNIVTADISSGLFIRIINRAFFQ